MRMISHSTFATLRVDTEPSHSTLPTYTLSRIATVPLTLLFATMLANTAHSVQTLASAILATVALIFAVVPLPNIANRGPIIAGVFSSLLTAIYPIILLRAYKQLVSDLVPQGDALVYTKGNTYPISTGTKEETRAYWRILHYTSLISIVSLLPLVLFSGEVWQISKECHALSEPGFWILMLWGGALSWAVLSTTLLLVKATSPLTANFVSLPRNALQLTLLRHSSMSSMNWAGAVLCWASSTWYLLERSKSGNQRGNIFG